MVYGDKLVFYKSKNHFKKKIKHVRVNLTMLP